MSVVEVELPRPHAGQCRVLRGSARFTVLCCGRRWGKTTFGMVRAAERALRDGLPVGWFAPTYRYLAEPWRLMVRALRPAVVRASEESRRIELVGGGLIQFWSLDSGDAGRGSKYGHVVIDEAAMVRNLEAAWHESVRPTLTDFAGSADFLSTPKGRSGFHALYLRGEAGGEWQSWRCPSGENPVLPAGEIEAARMGLPDRAFRQEYLAEFVDDVGAVFPGVRLAVDAGRTENEDAVEGRSYRVGVDVARVRDWTVITVLDDTGRQVMLDRFQGFSWERLAERVAKVARRYRATVTVDATGVGDPVCEALRRLGVRVRPFRFTAQSKPQLIERLAMRLERGEVRLMDVPVQTAELEAFGYVALEAGAVRLEAPAGLHDDTVCALALANWGSGTEAVVF